MKCLGVKNILVALHRPCMVLLALSAQLNMSTVVHTYRPLFSLRSQVHCFDHSVSMGDDNYVVGPILVCQIIECWDVPVNIVYSIHKFGLGTFP